MRMHLPDAQEVDGDQETGDAFHAHPANGRFDTVVISVNDDEDNFGIQGMSSSLFKCQMQWS